MDDRTDRKGILNYIWYFNILNIQNTIPQKVIPHEQKNPDIPSESYCRGGRTPIEIRLVGQTYSIHNFLNGLVGIFQQ